jgi:hypothetical protein
MYPLILKGRIDETTRPFFILKISGHGLKQSFLFGFEFVPGVIRRYAMYLIIPEK